MTLKLQFIDPKTKPDIETIVKEKLNLPKNYPARIKTQIKRHSESKTVDELKEHLKEDWQKNMETLSEFISKIDEIQSELTDYFYSNQVKLQQYIFDMEHEISQIDATHNQAYNKAFHQYKLDLIKSYIDLGISPDKAADIVTNMDIVADQLGMKELFKKTLNEWHDI